MRHGPGEARLLGLWTAGWLAVLLLAGVLWIGDPALQWPVFAVPLLWALVAARPRRTVPPPRRRDGADRYPSPHDRYPAPDDRHRAPDDRYPATREAPTLPPPPPGRRPRQW